MKINNLNVLLAITLALLLSAIIMYWGDIIKKPPTISNAQVTQTQIQTSVNTSEPDHSESSNHNHSHQSFNSTNTKVTQEKDSISVASKIHQDDIHSKSESFDFGKYITDPEHLDEISKATSQKSDDLPIETLSDGSLFMDHKGRFSTVQVAVVDENGEVHIGEWSPPAKP